MKLKLCIVFVALCAITLSSCKKQEIKVTPLASLKIINAVAGGDELQFGTNATTIPNDAYTDFGILTGNKAVKLNSTTAPNPVYYNQKQNFVVGGVYSLFLTGTPGAVESVFLKEKIPSHTNQVFGARVINLSLGNVPISVNLQGSANGSFVSSVAYKAVSDFVDVSSTAQDGDKVFEFRNAATGALISSFTVPGYSLPTFRNITLVFAGVEGSEMVFQVNNF